MSNREPAIRRAVDDFFVSVGSLIASQIADENAKLADLFRPSPDSGVASYGRPFVHEAMRKLVNGLLGADDGPPLWIGILLTGRLNSLTHVARRFIYWDYKFKDQNLLGSAGALWDPLINDETALRKHFKEKLSLSKWYETGLLEPAVRRVHLLNLERLGDNHQLGSPDPKSTAIGLWGAGSEKMSGMYHGLEKGETPRFDRYLKFLFGGNTGVALYTAVPIVSEHNVMKRSIGEVFLAEGTTLLSPASRDDLLIGLRYVALGLSARFFFIDQEDLENEKETLKQERLRLEKFEQRMTLIERPLRSLSEAIDKVRADAQSISMAVNEPTDGLFKYHRELSRYFTKQTLTVSSRLSIDIEHDTNTYTPSRKAIPVLYLLLGQILGFDEDFALCQSEAEIVALAEARLDTIKKNTKLEENRKWKFIEKFILDPISCPITDKTIFVADKAMEALDILKRVLHTPFKPDANRWPIFSLLIACVAEDNSCFPSIRKQTYIGLDTTGSVDGVVDLLTAELRDIPKLAPPYALHHLLKFICLLRNSQRGNRSQESTEKGPIVELHIHERLPSEDNQGQLISIDILYSIHGGDAVSYVKGVKDAIRRRIDDGKVYTADDLTGDALEPFEYLVRVGANWKCLRPRYISEDKYIELASLLAIHKNRVPSMMKCVQRKDVMFTLVPSASTRDTLAKAFICICRAVEDKVCASLIFLKK